MVTRHGDFIPTIYKHGRCWRHFVCREDYKNIFFMVYKIIKLSLKLLLLRNNKHKYDNYHKNNITKKEYCQKTASTV